MLGTRNCHVTCSRCRVTVIFCARTILQAGVRPRDKKDLLDGTVHRFVCPECGQETIYDFQLAYEDHKKRLVVWVSDEPPALLGGGSFVDWAKHYDLRLVRTRNELIEKVLVWDAKLDDRLVEYAKEIIRTQALRTSQPIDGDLMFSGVVKNDEGEKNLHFQDVTGDPEDSIFPFRWEFYRDLVKIMPPFLKKMPKQKSLWLRIDREYAQRLDRLVDGSESPRKQKRKR